MKSTVTRTVSVPADTVWSVLADHEGMSDWGPGMTARITKSGAEERNGLGAVREISSPLPVAAIVEEIIEFEPPRKFAYRALAGVPLKNYRGDVELSEADGRTTIRYSISGDARLPLAARAGTRVLALVLSGALVRQVKKAAG